MASQDDLPIQPGLVIPGEELLITTSRSSGPGGQHVNTSDTRVQLRWNVPASRALGEEQRLDLPQPFGPRDVFGQPPAGGRIPATGAGVFEVAFDHAEGCVGACVGGGRPDQADEKENEKESLHWCPAFQG